MEKSYRLSGQPVLSESVYLAFVRKYHRLGDLNNRNLFSHSFGVWKSKIKCWQVWLLLRLVSLAHGRGFLSGSTQVLSPVHARVLICSCRTRCSVGWCGSGDWALACTQKGHWFDSWLGHVPGLWARSPGGSRQTQPIDDFLTHQCSFFFFSLPSPLSKNK